MSILLAFNLHPGFYIAIGIALIVMILLVLSFLSVWLKAWASGAPVSLVNLIFMRYLRKLPYSLIVDARIMAVKAGINATVNDFETHYMAGGDIIQTVQGVITAKKAGIALTWNSACAIDLATKGTEKSILEAVGTSINPKVIDCPAEGNAHGTINGVAKDGVQVKARARVTVRSDLEHYVGSAQEETIIARVGEGIVTTIGSADSYKRVLENPASISKTVLDRGLDSGTAFEILSIDIADVDVGENIGAQLQVAQAEANKNMAQAQAEIRRAAAVAREQEMQAQVQEMQAKVVEAQAQVPLAMAAALREGNLDAMAYYHRMNLESGTDVRNPTATPEDDTQEPR